MQHLYPLKVLVLYKNKHEILLLEQFLQKHSDVFHPYWIATDIFHLLHVLTSEKFDVTFFDDAFPIDLIEKYGKDRFGKIIFKDKKTLSWDKNLLVKTAGYYFFEPPFTDDTLISSILADYPEITSVRYVDEPIESKPLRFRYSDLIVFIHRKDIICIKVRGKLSRVYCNYKNEVIEIMDWKSINKFELKIKNNNFFRASRTALINLNFIQDYDPISNIISLSKSYRDKTLEVFLSTRKRPLFNEVMKEKNREI